VLRKEEEQRLIKQNALIEEGNQNYLIDNDERWEKEFERMIQKEKDEEIATSEKEKIKRILKKKKKLLKNEKKKEKREKKNLKKVKELKELYESYGIKNFTESKSNIHYIPDFVPVKKPNPKEEQF
jgi:alanyl-tRNA synthetase